MRLGLLTPRQEECLSLFALGGSLKEIGRDLHISDKTVDYHLQKTKARLKIKSPQLLVHAAIALKLVPLQIPRTRN